MRKEALQQPKTQNLPQVRLVLSGVALSAMIPTESKSHRPGRLWQSVSPCFGAQVVGDLAVVCIDVEAEEIVAVFHRLLVEVQRGELLYMGVAL